MRRQGFTLPELLISMAVMAVLAVYLTSMLTQQNKAYAVIDQVTEVQSNARALIDLLESEMLRTGGGAPEALAVCGVDKDDGPDMLFVTDGSVYKLDTKITASTADPAFKDTEAGPLVDGPFPGTGTNVSIKLWYENTAKNPLLVDDTASFDLDNDGTKDSDFRPLGAVIVGDPYQPGLGTACGVIKTNGVDTATKTLTVDFSVGAANTALAALPSRTLMAVPAHRYSLSAAGELMRDGVVLVEDVEDFQVAYFFDTDGNGKWTNSALEYPGLVNGDPLYQPKNWDNSELREIQLAIELRSRLPDPKLKGAVPQEVLNRAAGAVADNYRRRVLTTVVRPRNVGNRLPPVPGA